MNSDKPEIDHFQSATEYLTKEGRWHVLDSLACMFHNQGYSLRGNTEENDAVWLARQICSHERGGGCANALDQLPEDRRAEYIRIAEIAIKSLPALCGRISARYINMSQALRTMEEVSRQQVHQAREEISHKR